MGKEALVAEGSCSPPGLSKLPVQGDKHLRVTRHHSLSSLATFAGSATGRGCEKGLQVLCPPYNSNSSLTLDYALYNSGLVLGSGGGVWGSEIKCNPDPLRATT